MDYCPKCGKRMIHMKKKNNHTVTLILSCKKCGYEKKVSRPNFNNTSNRNHRVEKLIILGEKEQKRQNQQSKEIVQNVIMTKYMLG